MKTIRNPHSHVVAETLREAVIDHAYRTNADNSVIAGIRHVSDLWLLARRYQSLDNIMGEVKIRETDPDISRITNDLNQSPEKVSEPRVSARDHAPDAQLDWMMV